MLEVDKTTFEEEVLKAEGYVLVDFYGDGCVPCAALMPHVHALADEYGDFVPFCRQRTLLQQFRHEIPAAIRLSIAEEAREPGA